MSFYHFVTILLLLAAAFTAAAEAAEDGDLILAVRENIRNENGMIATADNKEETEEEEDDPSLPHVEPPPGKQGNETGSYDQVCNKKRYCNDIKIKKCVITYAAGCHRPHHRRKLPQHHPGPLRRQPQAEHWGALQRDTGNLSLSIIVFRVWWRNLIFVNDLSLSLSLTRAHLRTHV